MSGFDSPAVRASREEDASPTRRVRRGPGRYTEVDCVACLALAGHRCVNQRGLPAKPHVARVRAWEAVHG